MRTLLRYFFVLLVLSYTLSAYGQDNTKRAQLEQRVEELRTQDNPKKLAKALQDLADYHFSEAGGYDYEAALPSLKEAFGISSSLNDQRLISDIGYQIGIMYRNAKSYKKALEYFEKVIPARKAIGNPNRLEDVYEYAGKSAIGAGRPNEAIKYLEKGLEVNKQTGRKSVRRRLLNQMANAYGNIGDVSKAEEMREKADAIFNETTKTVIKNEQKKTDSVRRALSIKQYELMRENAELEQEAARVQARVDSMRQEEKRQEEALRVLQEKARAQEEELVGVRDVVETLKSTTIGVSIFLLITLASGLLLYRAYKARVRLNQQLEAKNEEIEAQRDKLMEQHRKLEEQKVDIEKLYNKVKSSINYAQRIQFAMLPSIKAMRENFEDSFVYLQPRDPVSGDFYWMRNVDGKTVIAAVDCTGHGVPGAFMSLIGNDLLNTIVVERHILHPDKILHDMNEGVREALKQGVSQNNDGMDVALCVIDREERTVEFAGAKNPLYYLNGTGEMNVIKGDRNPIGGMQGELERNYTRHHIELRPGESYTFYLSSDGFQDQFGGREGRKFLRSNFRKLLQDIHQEPMDKQSDILETTLSDWMRHGEQRQIDDVLVVGFRV